jgi:hypothetical protein
MTSRSPEKRRQSNHHSQSGLSEKDKAKAGGHADFEMPLEVGEEDLLDDEPAIPSDPLDLVEYKLRHVQDKQGKKLNLSSPIEEFCSDFLI